MDFNQTAFGATVLSPRMAEVVSSLASHDIQRIPALVDAPGTWEVLNVLRCIECIDYEKSRIDFCPPDDPERPNKPRGMRKLVIDGSQVGNVHIFKPLDWTVVDIVSEELKVAIERSRISGADFMCVTSN